MGGGVTPEPTYETVAEIPVGEMGHDEGDPFYIADVQGVQVGAIADGDYYLNGESDKSTEVATEDNGTYICWNTTFEGQTRIDPDKPLVVIGISDGGVMVISDTPDLSNTTVRILKEASAPSGGGTYDVLFVLTPDGEGGFNGSTTVSLDDGLEAIEDGKIVRAQFLFNQTVLAPMESYYAGNPNTNNIVFWLVANIDGSGPSYVRIVWTADEVEVRVTPLQNKDDYSFRFAVTAGQTAGTYVATPDPGVTYAAITAALAETDNVYAVATLPTGSVFKAVFNDITDSGVAASGVTYTGSNTFTAFRVRLLSDETCDIAIVALAPAT